MRANMQMDELSTSEFLAFLDHSAAKEKKKTTKKPDGKRREKKEGGKKVLNQEKWRGERRACAPLHVES